MCVSVSVCVCVCLCLSVCLFLYPHMNSHQGTVGKESVGLRATVPCGIQVGEVGSWKEIPTEAAVSEVLSEEESDAPLIQEHRGDASQGSRGSLRTGRDTHEGRGAPDRRLASQALPRNVLPPKEELGLQSLLLPCWAGGGL